jgi:membrane protease YdiL (CAAX protease family)
MTKAWSWDAIILFIICVYCGSWLLILLALRAPQGSFSIPILGFSVSYNTLFILAGSMLPGIVVFCSFQESRSALLSLPATLHLYVFGTALGAALPLFGHLSVTDPYILVTRTAIVTYLRVFLLNFLLGPLWEEVLWRGFFSTKLAALLSPKKALLIGSLAWSIWHFGLLVFFFRSGVEMNLLKLLPIQYFCLGIILDSVLKLAKGALLPCVLLHVSYNASVSAYYGTYERAHNLGCYQVQTIGMIIIACCLFIFTFRQIDRRQEVTLL